MHRLRVVIRVALLCGCLCSLALWAQEQAGWVLESPHGVEYKFDTGLFIATNGVVVRYRGATLQADRAIVNQTTGEAEAEGNVRLDYQGRLWLGERIRYNFQTGKIIAENFRAGFGPLYVHSRALVGDAATGVYVGADNLITTDDYAEPSHSVYAKTVVVVPGQYVEAKQATVRLGQMPVWYFPYYRRSLRMFGPRFETVPGYRSADGPYLLNTYHYYWNEQLDGSLHLDGRLKRGLGVGPDLNWRSPRYGRGTFRYYYANDDDPGHDLRDLPIDGDRYRVYLSHQATPRTNLTVTGVLRYQSDPFIVRDFFESEYRRNVQPSTFLEVNQRWLNYSLDLLVQPRLHDFFETVERLPDLKLTGFRQQIGATPFYYESDSSVGYYQRKFPDGSTNQPFAALRADTFHQVVLPWTFFDWLNVTPRVGGRFTHYGEADGSGATTHAENRGVFNTGAEVSFKASRLWPGVQSRFWDLDGLRHILMPSVNYVFVPHPSVPPRRLPRFDDELPSTRLLPIDFPDYNAIDAIDSQNVLRLGLRNKLQTKRRGTVENLVHWAVYTDWRLDPRPGQGSFSDLYSDLDLKPLSWLILSSELRYCLEDVHRSESYHRLTVTPNDTWSISLGHRYLRRDLRFGPDAAHNAIFSTLYYRFNENWGVRLSHHFEARDGTLEEQYYSLYRDFRSWTGALTFRVRDHRSGPTDFTVALTFSMKAAPRYGLGDDSAKPSLLLGY